MFDVWSKFYIVEVLLTDIAGKRLPATVPAHFGVGICGVDIHGKSFHIRRRRITAHKAYAGDVVAIFLHKSVDRVLVEFLADVVP